MSGRVELLVDGAVATVVLANERSRNAMSSAMWRQLREGVEGAKATGGVRALVLRGAGRDAFCAGGDLGDLAGVVADAGTIDAYLRSVEEALAAVRTARLPTIAMLHGATVGGGLALACMCDLRLADGALRAGIPAVRIGIVPSTSELRAMAGLVGHSRALELLYTGRLLDAPTALEWGLVNRVTAPDELEAAARDLALEAAAAAPGALAEAKRLLLAESGADEPFGDVAPSARSLAGPEFGRTLARLRHGSRP